MDGRRNPKARSGRVLERGVGPLTAAAEQRPGGWTYVRPATIRAMDTTTNASLDLAQLRSTLAGPLLGPGDEGFDAARQAWNLAADQRPAAVAHATSADDVAAAVRFARERGLGV